MLILGIAASPRRGGNSEILLDEALRGAQSVGANVEKKVLQDMRIAPCQECYNCHSKGECIIKDDMAVLSSGFRLCDHIILASPIFFYGVSAQAKGMIDRCQSFWAEKYLLKRPGKTMPGRGLFISTAGSKGEKTFLGAILTVKYFFDSIGFNYWNDLLVKQVDLKGAVLDHPEILQKAFQLGQAIASSQETP